MDTDWGRYLDRLFGFYFLVLFEAAGNFLLSLVSRIGGTVNLCYLMHLYETWKVKVRQKCPSCGSEWSPQS